MKDKIKELKNLTNEITSHWIKEYFELEEDDYVDADWVANETGGVFNFADYWFSFQNILDCYKLGVTKKQLFEWYDKVLLEEIDLSLCDFILSPEKIIKKEQEYLERLKDNLIFAEQEFYKALEQYENK